MAMELACSRLCSVSTWGTSSLKKTRVCLDSRLKGVNSRIVLRRVRAAQEVDTEESNEEESVAPAEEVSKLRLKWEAGEQNKPPLIRERRWTGYVEKDTAGQTNIYAVEPTVYVSESVFSSGEVGSSAEAASNSAAVAFGLALIAVVSAAGVLMTVTKNAPVTPEVAVGYSGPPLSYYITKFTPESVVEESPAVVGTKIIEIELPEETILVEVPDIPGALE